MPKQSELMHYRLQAMLREHTFRDLEYLGVRPDVLVSINTGIALGKLKFPLMQLKNLVTWKKLMKVTPFETYQSYLSMKNHFTNRKYDFFRYGGKSSATVTSFNKLSLIHI